MLTIEDLEKIKAALDELDPNIEICNWGPSYGFAVKRKRDALAIIDDEINQLKKGSRNES